MIVFFDLFVIVKNIVCVMSGKKNVKSIIVWRVKVGFENVECNWNYFGKEVML